MVSLSRPDTPSTGSDDSAPVSRTAHKKACADAVSRQGWRVADPIRRISTRAAGSCEASKSRHAYVVKRKEGQGKEGSARPGPHAPNRQPSEPSQRLTHRVCMHASNSTRSPNEPHIAFKVLCMSRLPAGCHETAHRRFRARAWKEGNRRRGRHRPAARAIPTETEPTETPIVTQTGLAGRENALASCSQCIVSRGSEVALSPIPDLSPFSQSRHHTKYHVTYHICR
jgi:hypothetical protein